MKHLSFLLLPRIFRNSGQLHTTKLEWWSVSPLMPEKFWTVTLAFVVCSMTFQNFPTEMKMKKVEEKFFEHFNFSILQRGPWFQVRTWSIQPTRRRTVLYEWLFLEMLITANTFLSWLSPVHLVSIKSYSIWNLELFSQCGHFHLYLLIAG